MGTTTETLKIVNEVVYKGQDDSRRLKRDLKETERNVSKGNISFDKLALKVGAATAAFGVLAVGAQQFYNVLKSGAQVQAAANTFDSLAMSIGSTSDVMLNELRQATSGMISDLDLMQFASQATAMGLGETSTEIAQLAELGSVLGANFRGDAVAGMAEFNLLLANQSIPRLDSFGISASAVRTRIDELTKAFPGMSREAAFTQAVLEQGQITMAKLGDQSGNAAVQFATFEASLANARDEVLLELIEAFGDDLPAAVDTATDAIQTMSDVIDSDKIRLFIDFMQIGNRVARGFASAGLSELVPALQDANDEIDTTNFHMPVYARHLETATARQTEFAAGSRAGRTALQELDEEIETAVTLIPRYGDSMDAMGDAHDQLTAAANASTGALQEQNTFMASTFIDTLNSAEMNTLDVEQALLQQAAAAGADQTALVMLAAATGDYTEQQIGAALEMAALTAFIDQQAAAIAAGNVTWREALANIRAFRDELAQLPDSKTVTVFFDVVGDTGAAGLGPSISQNATGTPFFSGGLSVVGEFGPELVSLPRGAQVVSTNQTRNITNNSTFNANGGRGLQIMLQHLRRLSRPAGITG